MRRFLALLALSFAPAIPCGWAHEASDGLILERAAELLGDESDCNRADDHECRDGAVTVSLYCALRQATREVIGGSSDRTVAMEAIRLVIEEKVGGKSYPHRLMGYNNYPATGFADIREVISTAAERLARRRAIPV